MLPLSIKKREIKSESGFSFAIASQPFAKKMSGAKIYKEI